MIQKIKKILVPTDFSMVASNALTHACHWATDFGAKIVLYHVDNIFITNEVPSDFQEKSRRQLREIGQEYKLRFPDIDLEIKDQEGVFTFSINDVVKSENIDLVIMGTEGSNDWESIFLGNHTIDVLEDLKVPVLVIPVESVYKPLRKIVFATNFENEDTEVVSDTVAIAKNSNAEVQIVHITTDDDEEIVAFERKIMIWFKGIQMGKIDYPNISFKNIQTLGSVLSELQSVINQEHIDLVVLSTKSKNFIQKLFEGSFVRKMTYYSQTPFLVFHLKG